VVTTLVAKTEGVSQEVFEQFKADLLEFKDHVKGKLGSMATILAQMSRLQLREIKKFARNCGLSSNLIDNLCLCGSGEMSIDLAMHNKIPNRVFRSLTLEAKAQVNNLDTPCDVWTPRGWKVKPLRELSAFEIKDVIQPRVGIVPASQQVPFSAKMTTTQKRVDRDAESAFLYDGHNITSDKHVLIFGRDRGDAPGTRTISIKMTSQQWKRLRS